MTGWISGRVVSQHKWTDSLYSLYVQTDPIPFIAGQFCRIALDIDDKRIARPYSFVNSPNDSIHEFYYNHVPNGLLTEQLIKLSTDDTLWVASKGAGLFTLKQVQDAKTLWLFASGTALGVFLSILKTAEPWIRFQRIVLMHAVRFTQELTHQALIEELQATHPEQLLYFPCVSRETMAQGFHGRITHALQTGALEDKAGLLLNPATSSAMICGNPAMVKDTFELLKEKGLSVSHPKTPGQITIENYWKD
ncbi:MAG TPA: ferredoxin--NADP reductase [Gammaproteobacteria bacterium]|nr:ferredoxin--NADP reductase [Gammaproteobacteria bacterium]